MASFLTVCIKDLKNKQAHPPQNIVVQIFNPLVTETKVVRNVKLSKIEFTIFDADDIMDAVVISADFRNDTKLKHGDIIKVTEYVIREEANEAKVKDPENQFVRVVAIAKYEKIAHRSSTNDKYAQMLDNIAIPNILSIPLYSCRTHSFQCEHHDSPCKPNMQILEIQRVIMDTKRVLNWTQQPKYQLTLSDGVQIIEAILDCTRSHLIDSSQITKYDIVQITRWMPPGKAFIVHDLKFIQKCNHRIGEPKPFFLTLKPRDMNIIDFLWNSETSLWALSRRFPCGCTCMHKRKTLQISPQNSVMHQKDTGTNFSGIRRLIADSLVPAARNNDNGKPIVTEKQLRMAYGDWQYCVQCAAAVHFILPHNLNKLLLRIRQDLNNGCGRHRFLGPLLHKLLQFPFIFRVICKHKRRWRVLLSYWIQSTRCIIGSGQYCTIQHTECLQDKRTSLRTSYQAYAGSLVANDWIASAAYFVLRLVETGYCKKKHFLYVLEEEPKILDYLVHILRVEHIKQGRFEWAWCGKQRQQRQVIYANTIYRLLVNLVPLCAKYKKLELIQRCVRRLYVEDVDLYCCSSANLRFGQLSLNTLIREMKGNAGTAWSKIKSKQRTHRKTGNECQNPQCERFGSSLKLCKGCKCVNYCSKRCQKRDWNLHGHRTYCKLLQSVYK